jgi:hypothetical protein
VDAHRPDELTPHRQRPGHRTDHEPAPLRQRRHPLTNDQLARQIDELEQNLRRDDPSLAKQFNKLQRAHTRIDTAVFSLLATAAVLLAIALATTSPVAGFGGIVAYVAAFGFYHRHLRALDRPSSPHPPRTADIAQRHRLGESSYRRRRHSGARVSAPDRGTHNR